MSDINKEKLLNKYPVPITIDCTNKILNQMKYSICKIKNKKGKGTGFFCFIPNKNISLMITNNHVIDEEIIKENNIIGVTLNDDKEKIDIKLDNNRKIYTNKLYDVTIIEMKSEKIKEYIELDLNILNDNPNIYNESIYIPQYPEYGAEQKCAVSYGILKEINNEYDIIHLCSTKFGSSGSPILNISNNKLIGIHKESSNKYNYNKGTLLKTPINEFLNNINLIKKNVLIKKVKNEMNITEQFLDKNIMKNKMCIHTKYKGNMMDIYIRNKKKPLHEYEDDTDKELYYEYKKEVYKQINLHPIFQRLYSIDTHDFIIIELNDYLFSNNCEIYNILLKDDETLINFETQYGYFFRLNKKMI